jgi:uncharacterized protein
MVVKTIVHFEIPAADAGRLSEFYARVFGWRFEKTPIPGMDYWMISTGPQGKSVGGGMYVKTSSEDRPRNFVQVDSIDPAIAEFKAAGGREVTPKMEVPEMGWSFIGADPEGNVIALWEAKMRAAPPRRRARVRARTSKKRRK